MQIKTAVALLEFWGFYEGSDDPEVQALLTVARKTITARAEEILKTYKEAEKNAG